MAFNKRAIFLMIFYAFIFASVAVLTLLASDVFTVPYLTPFAHFLKVLISPFVPLIMPLYIGAGIKLYKHTPFPSRKHWLLQAGCIALQQSPRVLNDLGALYDWSKLGNGMGFMGTGLETDGFCALNDCTGSWVEAVLMATVVVGESLGWNWDLGYVQKWVDAVAEEAMKKKKEKKSEAEREIMEKGELVDEKAQA